MCKRVIRGADIGSRIRGRRYRHIIIVVVGDDILAAKPSGVEPSQRMGDGFVQKNLGLRDRDPGVRHGPLAANRGTTHTEYAGTLIRRRGVIIGFGAQGREHSVSQFFGQQASDCPVGAAQQDNESVVRESSHDVIGTQPLVERVPRTVGKFVACAPLGLVVECPHTLDRQHDKHDRLLALERVGQGMGGHGQKIAACQQARNGIHPPGDAQLVHIADSGPAKRDQLGHKFEQQRVTKNFLRKGTDANHADRFITPADGKAPDDGGRGLLGRAFECVALVVAPLDVHLSGRGYMPFNARPGTDRQRLPRGTQTIGSAGTATVGVGPVRGACGEGSSKHEPIVQRGVVTTGQRHELPTVGHDPEADDVFGLHAIEELVAQKAIKGRPRFVLVGPVTMPLTKRVQKPLGRPGRRLDVPSGEPACPRPERKPPAWAAAARKTMA